MSTHQASEIFCHSDHPEWGRGIILPSSSVRQDRIDLSFESGGRRILLKSFAAKLQPADVTPNEASVLKEKLAARRAVIGPIKIPKSKAKAKGPAVVLGDFAAQVKQFESLFPGGFRGEKFERVERGLPGAKRRNGDKTAALARAAEAFSPAAFENGTAIFEATVELARSAGLVHPLDGPTTLSAMPEERRPGFIAALRDLLYGSGPEAERFDAFVASLQSETAGTPVKRPSWPLVTMFAALVHPKQQLCVKPTAFRKQAALLGLPLDYTVTPKAAVYEQFLAIARATEAALKQAGHEPRDFIDVYSFISVTHGAKQVAMVAGQA